MRPIPTRVQSILDTMRADSRGRWRGSLAPTAEQRRAAQASLRSLSYRSQPFTVGAGLVQRFRG